MRHRKPAPRSLRKPLRASGGVRVLIIHNRYRRPGGEDAVVSRESRLLTDAGHDTTLFQVSNEDFRGPAAAVRVAAALPYSRRARSLVDGVLADTRPDLVHVHNFFPLLTPSVFGACADVRVAVVHTLHNYRLLCANGLLLRDGGPCELCVQGSPYNAVRYACYRESRLVSASVARMIAIHRRRRTWQTSVDRYIALTAFGKELFVRGGLPSDKISVKPNFAPGPARVAPSAAAPLYALFLGELTRHKGTEVLLDAWHGVPLDLHVAGDGPLADLVRQAAATNGRISYLGRLDREGVETELAGAAFLVFPSVIYETFGLALVEAFAQATPVLASGLGAAGQIVLDGETGLHFAAGDAADLAAKATWLAEHGRERDVMGRRARDEYEQRYTAERNLELLLGIYADARAEALSRYGSGPAFR
jgi:glycosyltransferase involved in cell wall biosynthesis